MSQNTEQRDDAELKAWMLERYRNDQADLKNWLLAKRERDELAWKRAAKS